MSSVIISDGGNQKLLLLDQISGKYNHLNCLLYLDDDDDDVWILNCFT